MEETAVNTDKAKPPRAPLTPGQRKKRRRKIILYTLLTVILLAALNAAYKYADKYYLAPRRSQKEAYNAACAAREAGDIALAIENFAHAGERDALGSIFISARGGAGAYKDADEARMELSLALIESAAVGDTVYLGRFEQDANAENGTEAIAWRVVARNEDALILICEKGIDCRSYNADYLKVNWSRSSLRRWLNGEFYNTCFTAAEKELIPAVELDNPENPVFGGDAAEATLDRVYIPSYEEVLAWFADDAARTCASTEYAKLWGANYREDASWWWLRTSGDSAFRAAVVHFDGSIYYDGYTVTMRSGATVRPVIHIDLTRIAE